MEKQDVEEGQIDNAENDNQLLQRERVIWLRIFPAGVIKLNNYFVELSKCFEVIKLNFLNEICRNLYL